MVSFESKQKQFEVNLKIKLCGNRLYHTESVKYLDMKIETNISCQYHVNIMPVSCASLKNWIEARLSFWKWANVFDLKY